MDLILAILPVALLIVAMTAPPARLGRPPFTLRLPIPAHLALPGAALLAYALQLAWFRPGVEAATTRLVHAGVIDGALSALTPLAIVFGAVLLFKTMEKSGAMAVLAARLRTLTADRVAQVMLVGWSFSFLIEGLSGFGTPAALAAPILVGLGFPALRVAAACLIMNSVPVSFGAVGTPTWFGLDGLGLTPEEIGEVGWRTALIHAAAAPAVAVLALRLVVPWTAIRARLGFVLLVVAASVGPYLLTARFSVEFPSIVGGLSGLLVAGMGGAVLARRRGGLPRSTANAAVDLDATHVTAATAPARAPLALWRAAAPLVLTVLILAATRIEALGLRGLLTAPEPAATATIGGGALGEVSVSPALVVGLRGILGTDAAWSMPLLYVPFIVPFVLVALLAIPLLGMARADVGSAWKDSALRLARPAVALVGALVLVKMMMLGDESSSAMLMGRAMADAAGGGGVWPYVAPLLGALGAFFSGSNTVSNLTFAPVQAAIAGELGLDRVSILALQNAGGALGNMVCIPNILAVAAVLGLTGGPRRDDAGADITERNQAPDTGGVASILRLTVLPMLAYAAIAAVMAAVLGAIYGT